MHQYFNTRERPHKLPDSIVKEQNAWRKGQADRLLYREFRVGQFVFSADFGNR